MTWLIEDAGHGPAHESVFAIGNGYLGVRGAPEEGTPAYDAGTVLNGFYESWPINYPEDAYGLARTGQTIVAPPDGSIVRLLVDGEPLDITTARVTRALDMRAGVLRREVELETPAGARLRVRSRRLASLVRRNLVAIDYEVTVLEGAASVVLSSELRPHEEAAADDDPRRHKGFAERPLDPVAAETLGARVVLTLATRRSGLTLACGMHNDFAGAASVETMVEGDAARTVAEAELATGGSLRLRKYVAYHWSAATAPGDMPARAHRTLDRAAGEGYAAVERAHSERVAAFWERSDVEVEGAPDVQRAVRFNLFQLHAGDRSRRGPRRAREGRQRPRLRRPLLLGLRGLRHAVPHPRQPGVGEGAAARALRHARRRAPAGARRRPRGRALPVAHDQRRGGVRLVRGRHRAVPHQRRHRLRDAPLQPRLGRPRLPARAGRGGAGGDRALLDGARVLLRAPRRRSSASTR